MDIEASNPDLSSSKKVDNLVWRDCVNNSFPLGSASRPLISSLLWKEWVTFLTEIAIEFPTFAKAKGWKSPLFRASRLLEILDILEKTPMNRALLSETDIGRSIRDFMDTCNTIVPKGHNVNNYTLPRCFPNVWEQIHDDTSQEIWFEDEISGRTEASSSPSILDRLESLLNKWDEMESASDVSVTNISTSSSSTIPSAQEKKYLEQYRRDIEMMRQCHSWRQLYKALSTRKEEQMTKSTRGAKIRKLEESLDVSEAGLPVSLS